jgi:hypothetical protein
MLIPLTYSNHSSPSLDTSINCLFPLLSSNLLLLACDAEPFGGLLTVDDGQPDLFVYDGLELGLLRAGGGLVRRLLLGQGAGDHHQRIGRGGGGGASDGRRAVSPRGGSGALVAPAMQLVVPGISNLCSPPRLFLDKFSYMSLIFAIK